MSLATLQRAEAITGSMIMIAMFVGWAAASVLLGA
jgi:hypothetical protein